MSKQTWEKARVIIAGIVAVVIITSATITGAKLYVDKEVKTHDVKPWHDQANERYLRIDETFETINDKLEHVQTQQAVDHAILLRIEEKIK